MAAGTSYQPSADPYAEVAGSVHVRLRSVRAGAPVAALHPSLADRPYPATSDGCACHQLQSRDRNRMDLRELPRDIILKIMGKSASLDDKRVRGWVPGRLQVPTALVHLLDRRLKSQLSVIHEGGISLPVDDETGPDRVALYNIWPAENYPGVMYSTCKPAISKRMLGWAPMDLHGQDYEHEDERGWHWCAIPEAPEPYCHDVYDRLGLPYPSGWCDDWFSQLDR